MTFNIQGLPWKLTGADVGAVDYADALAKGFKNYQGMAEAVNTPKRLSEALLAQQLQNKINTAKADYAERNEAAGLQSTLAGTENTRAGTQNLRDTHGMSGLNRQLLQQKINSANYEAQLRDRINSALTGKSSPTRNEQSNEDQGLKSQIAPAPGAIPAPTLKDNLTDGLGQRSNGNVQSPGNPELYRLDYMVDSDPQAAAYIKKNYGLEKKVTPKFDPKTGVTSVITQYPSGKIEVTQSSANNGGFATLTAAVKTKAENTINGVDNALPILDRLIEGVEKGSVPGQWIGKYFSPDQQATYESEISKSAETFANALGYPNTNEGYTKAEHVVKRRERESDKNYAKRLKDLKEEALQRKKNSQKILNSGTSIKSNLQGQSKKNDPLGIR